MCALVTVVQTCALPISGHGRTSAAITGLHTAIALAGRSTIGPFVISRCLARPQQPGCSKAGGDRKSVVWGKSVSVRVDLGGRRIIKKKISQQLTTPQIAYPLQLVTNTDYKFDQQ